MTRATDLPVEARAFLDALAVGESGGADDDGAYSILFGGGHFIYGSEGELTVLSKAQGLPRTFWPPAYGWPRFPQWHGVWLHGVPTHAAGRYQFEPATWRDVAGRIALPDFSPVSQDHAAWLLACEVYHRKGADPVATGGGLLAALQIAATPEILDVVAALKTTWTSLSAATFPARYRAALAKLIK